MGILPLSYLSGNEEFKIQNFLTNAKQILSQFLKKQGIYYIY